METKAKSFRNEKGIFPTSSTANKPGTAGADCVYAREDETAWVTAGFGQLGFHVDEPSRYQYGWTGGAVTTATGIARGDLDCDTVFTTQTLTLTVSQGNVHASYTDPTPD
jgi:hypothetical protein